MNKDMICPVCNARLRPIGGFYDCPNDHREWAGTRGLWQALIQAKQDLKKSKERYSVLKKKVLDWQMEAIVRNTELKIARNALEELRGDKRLPPQTPWEIIADKALKQIEQKEEHDGIPL